MLEMHAGLLLLLKELDAICRKHGITYYLEGGSLLGAVRHKGFLPWDDDVDLCITRDNFQKLLSVIDQELPPNRELYCYERFPGYLRDTVKYTNLDTTVLFRNHILDGCAAGQHIDLFILDPAPSDPAGQEEFKKLATVYSELMSPVYVLCDDVINYLDEYNMYRKMMEEKGRDYVLNLLREKLFTLPDNDECDTYLLRWGNRHSFYAKDFFGEPVDLPFEDALFPAPRQYFRFLRAEFGDSWMIVPDEAHQEDHSTFDKYHIPCKTFVADYSPFIDYKKMWNDNVRRKQHNLNLLIPRRKIQQDNAEMTALLSEITLEEILPALTGESRKLLQEQNFARLAELFEPFYEAQMAPILMQQGRALKTSEPVLYAAALALIMVGRFGQAEKILKISTIRSSRIEGLFPLITDIRACMLAAEEGRFEDAKALAEKWIGNYPRQLNLAAFLLRQELREKGVSEDLITRTRALLEHYPNNDELMLLLGDLLTQDGKTAEAERWYRSCAAITRNGLFLMALPEFVPCSESDEATDERKA